jgi:hypothetical protein
MGLFEWFKGNRIPQIEVFVRHCNYSSASAHKERFSFFSRKGCFQNLIDTADLPSVNVTFFLDTFHPTSEEHFIAQQTHFPVIEIKAGKEGESFLQMIHHVAAQKFSPETIIYFLEDDYIHKKGWVDVLREAFTLPNIDYVTLYDHKDKYFLPSYETLESRIFHTGSCHWRTTPSTTNTYAMKFKTLLRDFDVHREFSLGKKITEDHAKFCRLREKGAVLISSIPGWATHAEPKYASPCTDWEKVLLGAQELGLK